MMYELGVQYSGRRGRQLGGRKGKRKVMSAAVKLVYQDKSLPEVETSTLGYISGKVAGIDMDRLMVDSHPQKQRVRQYIC